MVETKNAGFTLIEVITTLLILGIITTVAVARIDIIKKSELDTFAAGLKASLRYIQSHAMATESTCSLLFTGNTYKYQDGNSMDQTLPGQNQITVTAPSGVTISVTPDATLIAFDSWGRPGLDKTDNNPDDGLLDVSAGSVITISNSEDNKKLTITQETGYIRTQ